MGEDSRKKRIKKSADELSLDDNKKFQAVAVKYNVDEDQAPKIVASGRGKIAQEIVKIAEENSIPLYEDPSLADLLSKLDVEEEIPPELYTLVAEVLSFVYQLDRMAKKKSAIRKKFKKI